MATTRRPASSPETALAAPRPSRTTADPWKPDLMLIDGHAVVHRAFHAMGVLTTSSGELVNAVYGFAAIVLKALADLQPKYLAVAFDRAAPTFRHTQFAAYKAQRPRMDPALAGQFARVRELVQTLNIPILEMDGYEADDILGTLAAQASAQQLRTVIVTGDNDALQLVSPLVRVLTPRRTTTETTLYDEGAVFERYGVQPQHVPDYKGLVGDSSDNIPGVKGIGDKSASKLLAQFETIEELYQHLDEVPQRQRDLLAPFEQDALYYKALATIETAVPITLDLPACRVAAYDRAAALTLFSALEFRSLIPRLPQADGAEPPAQITQSTTTETPPTLPTGLPLDGLFAGLETPASAEQTATPLSPLIVQTLGGAALPTFAASAENTAGEMSLSSSEDAAPPAPQVYIIDTLVALDDLIQRLRVRGEWALDLETTSLREIGAEIVGISLAVELGLAYYIPVGHLPELGQQLDRAVVLERLRPVLEDPTLAKLAHNGKYDMLVLLANYGIKLQGLTFDTMIAAYLVNPTQRGYGLKDQALSRLGIEMKQISELIGKGKTQLTMAQAPIRPSADYAGADVDATLRLRQVLAPELHEKELEDLFTQVEMPLVPVLADMEYAGVDLDVAFLTTMSGHLQRQCDDLARQIYEQVGHTFNLNSPKQLSDVLFQELGLPPGRKTATGYSTDADVLERLSGSHGVVDMLLEYRQLIKLKGTYVDGLPPLINPRTGRLHTSYNQTQAATGRLSSSDPNLQNIPIRTELGREIRRAFITRDPGTVLLAADYSQIELRILAHLSGDARLRAAFAQNEDIHMATAALMMGRPLDQVTSEMRRLAKTTNYGVIYGLSDFGLSRSAGIPRSEARTFIETYNQTYSGVATYMEELRQQARTKGYVATMLGRRRYLPEIMAPERVVREAAERAAINMPIQGTQADLIKIAMIRIAARLRDMQGKAQTCPEMILQVHDELVFRVPEDCVPQTAAMVQEIMEGAMHLDVPIRVDVRIGQNWADLTAL